MKLSNITDSELDDKVIAAFLKTAGSFKSEFKTQLLTALSAALGFLMAFAWRDPFTTIATSITTWLTAQGVGTGMILLVQTLQAIVMTIVCVTALIILSKWQTKKDGRVK
jgi:4-amino-4-deoxy-L-arabinose transferase-like glycosyltransferase